MRASSHFGADEAEPDRQPAHLAHRHGEVRIAGDRGEAAGGRRPGSWSPWTASISQAAGRVGRDQGDDIVARAAAGRSPPARRGGARSRAPCGRPRRGRRSPRACSNSVLAEQRHLGVGMGAVEGDQVGERAASAPRPAASRDRRSGRASARRAARRSRCGRSPAGRCELGISTSSAPCARSTASAASNGASVPKPAEKRITPIRTPRSASGRSAAV